MPSILSEIRAAFEHQIEVYGPVLQGEKKLAQPEHQNTVPGNNDATHATLAQTDMSEATVSDSAYERIRALIQQTRL